MSDGSRGSSFRLHDIRGGIGSCDIGAKIMWRRLPFCDDDPLDLLNAENDQGLYDKSHEFEASARAFVGLDISTLLKTSPWSAKWTVLYLS